MYNIVVVASLLVSAVIAVLGSEKDISVSSLYDYYGQREKIKISRNDYGGFNAKINRIGSWAFVVGIVGLSLVLEYTVQPWVFIAGCVALLGIAAYRFIHAKANWNDMLVERATKQVPLLEHWAKTGVFEDPYNYLGDFQDGYPSRKFYRLFAWVYSVQPKTHDAKQEVDVKLLALAQKPRDQWFPK